MPKKAYPWTVIIGKGANAMPRAIRDQASWLVFCSNLRGTYYRGILAEKNTCFNITVEAFYTTPDHRGTPPLPQVSTLEKRKAGKKQNERPVKLKPSIEADPFGFVEVHSPINLVSNDAEPLMVDIPTDFRGKVKRTIMNSTTNKQLAQLASKQESSTALKLEIGRIFALNRCLRESYTWGPMAACYQAKGGAHYRLIKHTQQI